MTSITRNKPLFLTLVIYSVLFYTIWCFFELYGEPWLEETIENPTVLMLVRNILISNLVWTLPAVLLIRRFSSDVRVNLKEMFTTKVNWLKVLPVYAFFIAFVLISTLIRKGSIQISEDFTWQTCISILFIGLTEEMVFRGWLLNATAKAEKPNVAIGVNAVMFLLIHFPVWIIQGVFVSNFKNLAFVTIIVMSIIYSLGFLKTKNILVSISLHIVWDVLAFLIVQ